MKEWEFYRNIIYFILARTFYQNFSHITYISTSKTYLKSLKNFKKLYFILLKIKTLEQEKEFTELLKNTLSCTSDTLPLLIEGFRESKRHIKVKNFYFFKNTQ